MAKKSFSILLLLLLFCNMIYAQWNLLPAKHSRAVNSSGFYVSPSEYDYTNIATEASRMASSKYDKAINIYLWICKNIIYDTETNIRTADQCWNTHRAVCQGYCELYYRMAETLNLRTTIVYGMSRNSTGRIEDHAWLMVETEKGNILLDPTWGAGSVINGKFEHSKTPLLWFDVNPCWFVFTHLPKSGKYQMLDPVVSKDEFTGFCYASPFYERIGLKPERALSDALAGADSFPIISHTSSEIISQISITEVPLQFHLRKGKPYKFSIQKNDNFEFFIRNENDVYDSTQWRQINDRFVISICPKYSGKLELCTMLNNKYVHQKRTLIEYFVE